MHLVIISGAARPQRMSNTAKIIEVFRKGYEETGNTTEVWYLSNRNQWPEAKAAGGFPEASQSRCCEKYLETLPAQLGCVYAGTLIKGDMFGVSLMDEKNRAAGRQQ